MSKKYWTYDLTKAKKSGAKLLNKDYEQFLEYAYDYNWHRAIYFEKNKLTVSSFYVDKDIIKEKTKKSDFTEQH